MSNKSMEPTTIVPFSNWDSSNEQSVNVYSMLQYVGNVNKHCAHFDSDTNNNILTF